MKGNRLVEKVTFQKQRFPPWWISQLRSWKTRRGVGPVLVGAVVALMPALLESVCGLAHNDDDCDRIGETFVGSPTDFAASNRSIVTTGLQSFCNKGF